MNDAHTPRVITDAEAAEALAAEWPDQRPVSLPERLDDEADLCANEGADDIAGLLSEAATELRALAGRVRELEAVLQGCLAMLERADCSTGYCCCGSPIEGHGIGDGHGPVDEGDYHQLNAMDAARAALSTTPESAAQPEAVGERRASMAVLQSIVQVLGNSEWSDIRKAEEVFRLAAAPTPEPMSAATEPSDAERDDPLQGAVDWLLQADGEFFCVATVQRTLRIGYNRANRLSEVAKERATKGGTP